MIIRLECTPGKVESGSRAKDGNARPKDVVKRLSVSGI
jgi:hypothetical protein